VVIKHRIGEIYTHWPFYGSRRITVKLNQEEIPVSRLTVQRYMREMGISGIAPGPNTCKLAPEHKIYPYLLRQVSAQYPNHVWGIDITYIRPVGGWMYLVAILDWFSRFVIAWELDQTLELFFVLTAVDHALSQATPFTGTVIKAATSSARYISSAFPPPASRSAWIAAVGQRIISLPNACGIW